MSLANEVDDRTVEQQLRDLGVDVIRKNSNNTVTGVRWVQKNKKRSKPGKPAITVGKKGLYFNVYATKMLKPNGKQYDFGAGDYQGKRVILLRESKNGYKLSFKEKCTRYAISHAISMVEQLLNDGIKLGRYELVKLERVQGGYMGVPAE